MSNSRRYSAKDWEAAVTDSQKELLAKAIEEFVSRLDSSSVFSGLAAVGRDLVRFRVLTQLLFKQEMSGFLTQLLKDVSQPDAAVVQKVFDTYLSELVLEIGRKPFDPKELLLRLPNLLDSLISLVQLQEVQTESGEMVSFLGNRHVLLQRLANYVRSQEDREEGGSDGGTSGTKDN